MVRRTALTVGLVSVCLWGLLLVARADSAQGGRAAPPQRYEPVAPADALRYAQAHHLDRLADLANAPDVADRYRRVRQEAYVLAELFNLSARQADTDEARMQAALSRDRALALAQAAARQDQAEVALLTREVLATHPSSPHIQR